MSAMFERLSRLLSTPGTNENQATDDGNETDAGIDDEDHRTFTLSVFQVATDAEGQFTYDYEGEMIKPDCIPLETRLSIITNQILWPSVNAHVNAHLKKTSNGEAMSYRASYIHKEIVSLANEESEIGRGHFEGDKETVQKTWLHNSNIWYQAQQRALLPPGSTVPPSSTSTSHQPSSKGPPPTAYARVCF